MLEPRAVREVRLSVALASLLIPAAFCARAPALEIPSVSGLGVPSTPGDEDKRFSFFAGYAYGTDSNPLRTEATATEEEVAETVGGIVFKGGNTSTKIDLAGQLRMDQYQETTSLDFTEWAAYGRLGRYSEKATYGAKAKYSSLAQPTDLVVGATAVGQIEWTDLTWAGYGSFNLGRTEIAAEYVTKTLDYADSALSGLDLEDTATSGELRWWSSETKYWLVHYDKGEVKRTSGGGPNFDYTRMYLGMRTETPRRSGIEVGVGTQTLDNFSTATEDADNMFALLRSSWMLGAGRSGLDLAYVYSSEPSASSTYKNVSGVVFRFRNSPNRNFNWAVGARAEMAELVDPYYDSVRGKLMPDGYTRLVADAQINILVGSPSGWHGRIYLTAEMEQRTTGDSDYDYDRLRLLGGFALVR